MKSLLLILFIFNLGYAHGLKVFVKEENAALHVKAYFSKSAPCQQCKIEVFDKNDKLLLSKTTDDTGMLSFPLLTQEVKVVANASMGHRGETTFKTDTPITQEYPVWIKLLLALFLIAMFFGGLQFAKRRV